MRIILLGAPGAGKGTLATAIKTDLGLLHVSTGDILREHIKSNTALGKQAKQYIDNGELVPDELVIKLIEDKLSADPAVAKGFMLDGFPRNKKQAEDLDVILNKIKKPIDLVLCLEATLPILIERLTGRRVCKACGAVYHVKNIPSKKDGICDKCQGPLYQRPDDNEETIKTRMDVYEKSTQPIIDFYEEHGKVFKLDADKDASEVQTLALKILNEK